MLTVNHRNNRDTPEKAGILFCFICCLICCLFPGVFMMLTANHHLQYGDWESAQAKVMNTAYCGKYRRKLGRGVAGCHQGVSRKLQDAADDSDELDKIFSVNNIPSVETGSGPFRSVSTQPFVDYDDHKPTRKENGIDSSDDSGDDVKDEAEIENSDAPASIGNHWLIDSAT